MEKLVVSKHLHVVQRAEDFAVYHKLFGNLCLMDRDALETLRAFDSGQESDARPAHAAGTFVKELQERFFLVPHGFDERSVIDEDRQFRTRHLESGYLLKGVQLVLTNDCNLGCSYCFQETIHHKATSKFHGITIAANPKRVDAPAQTGAPPPGLPAAGQDVKKMPIPTAVEAVGNALDVVRKAGNKGLSVEFFGGEPLLNWPAIEAVLNRFGNETEDGIRLHYSITTNATRVTDAIARRLREHEVTVTVSFDSPKNVNRVSKRGDSVDHVILKGLDTLSRNDSIITFNTVVSVDNVDQVDIDGLLEIAQKHKIRMIGLILDLDVKPYEDQVRMRRVVDTVVEICQRAEALGVQVTGYWHQIFEQIIGAQLINLQKGYKTCAAEGCKLSFEPNGAITNCKTGEKPIGHTSAVAEVFKTPWYKSYAMKAYDTTPFCRGCPVEGFCSGLCMGTLLKTYSDPNALVPGACDVYRNLTEKLIRIMPDHAVERLSLA